MGTDNETITILPIASRGIAVIVASKGKKPDGRIPAQFQDIGSARKSFRDVDVYEPFKGKRAISLKSIPKDFRDHLLHLLALKQAAELGKMELMHSLREDGVKKGFYAADADPTRVIASFLNVGLYASMFVVWMDNGQRKLRPGLLCRNMQSAYFAHVFFNLGTPSAARVCLNCRRKLHGRQRQWCSDKCKSAVNMPRYRAKVSGSQR